MANVLVEETSLQNIANSIREKTGTTDTYKPSEMASAISSIETGGGGSIKIETQTYTPAENEIIHEFTHNLGVVPNIIMLYALDNHLYSAEQTSVYFVYAMRNLFPNLENRPKQVITYKDSSNTGNIETYGRVRSSYSDITTTTANTGTCIIEATEQSFTYDGNRNNKMVLYQGVSYGIVLISGVSE